MTNFNLPWSTIQYDIKSVPRLTGDGVLFYFNTKETKKYAFVGFTMNNRTMHFALPKRVRRRLDKAGVTSTGTQVAVLSDDPSRIASKSWNQSFGDLVSKGVVLAASAKWVIPMVGTALGTTAAFTWDAAGYVLSAAIYPWYGAHDPSGPISRALNLEGTFLGGILGDITISTFNYMKPAVFLGALGGASTTATVLYHQTWSHYTMEFTSDVTDTTRKFFEDFQEDVKNTTSQGLKSTGAEISKLIYFVGAGILIFAAIRARQK